MRDELDDLIDGPKRGQGDTNLEGGFIENCPKCRGTGRFYSWNGRDVGPCRACQGKGKKSFKTSTTARAANRDGAARRKERNAAENFEFFKGAHEIVAAWIVENQERFDFAKAMREAVEKYGSLTERQMAACQNAVMKRNASREDAKVRVETAAPIDTTKIEAAFTKASAVLKKPVLRVAGFVISHARAESKNAGALYVCTVADVYLGKIMGGKFFRSKNCMAEQETDFRTVADDPKEAAIRYGRLSGHCACCGRLLTNEDSVARGIGPICAENFGW